ncbi:hypothetical protein AALO_G00225860 [Alosa alosa]|uniref:Uncharacterized protein n=1 Tax=Alosa alosa TaxID=278164 RepID=A0AAV6G158_9TELE|nr:uncharacterized protein LOC125310295 [Alosa alosa]KAG5267797.1 hypothetical protein AALO_G00225860 [Alosa alosa]
MNSKHSNHSENMEEISSWRESYQMKFIFYLADDLSSTINPPENATMASPHSKTYTVAVRLSNTEEKPLTKHNLQVLSMSIPDLHQRITGSPQPFTFHKAYLQWDAVPRTCPGPQTSTPPKSSSPTHCTIPSKSSTPVQCIIPPKALRRSLGKPDITTHATPNKEDQPSCSVQENETTAPDWLKCDGSFIPGLSNKEWTTVSFENEEFVRCISPVAYTDNARDVAGRCNIADYTEYGQLVFSVDVDFLQRWSVEAGGEELTGPTAAAVVSDERMKQPQTPSSRRKTPRSKKRHSATTQRSSGASHATASRSPIRI